MILLPENLGIASLVFDSANMILAIGFCAALLQLVGYVIYLRDSHIEPNPVTWLMFSYGTIILTLLELDSEASMAELLLPSICAVMAVCVAGRCWLRAVRRTPGVYWPREWWPEDWRDRSAFQFDLFLTGMYICVWFLLHFELIGQDSKEIAVLAFLIAANMTTFSAFFPLLRSVAEDPDRERTLPWAIWASAYAMLGVATYASQGDLWNELMIYPVVNAVLHGSVAYLSRASRRALCTPRIAFA